MELGGPSMQGQHPEGLPRKAFVQAIRRCLKVLTFVIVQARGMKNTNHPIAVPADSPHCSHRIRQLQDDA